MLCFPTLPKPTGLAADIYHFATHLNVCMGDSSCVSFLFPFEQNAEIDTDLRFSTCVLRKRSSRVASTPRTCSTYPWIGWTRTPSAKLGWPEKLRMPGARKSSSMQAKNSQWNPQSSRTRRSNPSLVPKHRWESWTKSNLKHWRELGTRWQSGATSTSTGQPKLARLVTPTPNCVTTMPSWSRRWVYQPQTPQHQHRQQQRLQTKAPHRPRLRRWPWSLWGNWKKLWVSRSKLSARSAACSWSYVEMARYGCSPTRTRRFPSTNFLEEWAQDNGFQSRILALGSPSPWRRAIAHLSNWTRQASHLSSKVFRPCRFSRCWCEQSVRKALRSTAWASWPLSASRTGQWRQDLMALTSRSKTRWNSGAWKTREVLREQVNGWAWRTSLPRQWMPSEEANIWCMFSGTDSKRSVKVSRFSDRMSSQKGAFLWKRIVLWKFATAPRHSSFGHQTYVHQNHLKEKHWICTWLVALLIEWFLA